MENYRRSNIESLDLYKHTPRYPVTTTCKWFLLPDCSPEDLEYFSNCAYGFIHIYQKIIIDRGKLNIQSTNTAFVLSDERVIHLELMAFNNQTFRWKIKRLIQKWRVSRLKQVNTDDIVTGEPPLSPVYIYDWAQRSKYVLEASSVYKDVCTRLFNSDGLFNNTLSPRNMFTNNILTTGQLHFITEDLRKYGFANWAIQGLQSCNYAINLFKRIYKQAIHLECLKRCFANHTSNECIDLMIDFIELEYEYHQIECINTSFLLWYIKEHIDCPIIQAWRKLCFKYYKHAYMNDESNFADIIHVLSRDIMKTSLTFVYEKYKEHHNLYVVIYNLQNVEGGDDDDYDDDDI